MAETIPLNKFRLLTAELQSGNNLIYSSSLDVAAILLSTQITNITSSNQTVSVVIQKSGSLSSIVLMHSGSVPPDESLNPLAGKIVLEKHDSFIINTSETGKLHVVLSVLENAIN